MRFIILGAGLSGLSCGIALAENGHEVVIVEKEPEVGGLARSFRTNGYTFDYGPHFLFGPKVLPLLKSLIPELDLMPIKRTSERIYFRNRYFKFPFDPKDLLLHMEPSKIPCALFDILFRNILKKSDKSSVNNVEDWVIHSVGKRIYNYMSLGGYIQNLYGIPAKKVSQDWGIQKLKFLARWRDVNLFSLVLKALTEEKSLKAQVVNYPHSGIDRLALNLSDRFTRFSGKIHFNSKAISIEQKQERISVHLLNNGKEEDTEGDFLISSIPITNLLKMMSPSPPKEILRLADSLRYRALLLLFICLKKEKALDYQCIYFTENRFSFRRITEFKNLDISMAPQTKTSLCVEITCFENDEMFRRDSETIFKDVIQQLENCGFMRMDDVESYSLLRIPYAYPVYDINYNMVLNEMLNYLSNFDKLISIGRQGLFFYNNMSNCILSGYDLGQKLSTVQEKEIKNIIHFVYSERKGKYGSKK
ncbi:MAG: FAD-dependent oxidoreductase [Thermodesulfovibrionales bacterium]